MDEDDLTLPSNLTQLFPTINFQYFGSAYEIMASKVYNLIDQQSSSNQGGSSSSSD